MKSDLVKAATLMGSKGGKKGRGKKKARTSAQCRKAARARWAKQKKRKGVGR